MCLCTGFLSYSGPFNQEFRNKLLSNWERGLSIREIPSSSELNPTEMLIDAPTVSMLHIAVKSYDITFQTDMFMANTVVVCFLS